MNAISHSRVSIVSKPTNSSALTGFLALCSFLLISLAPTQAPAQNLNQPKHIPNQFQNKINHVRLQGVVQRENASDKVGEARQQHIDTNAFGFNRNSTILSPQDGCNINIGNTSGGGVGGADDKNVIVAGDVINFCK